jgi:hypothetical protein
MKSFSIFVIVFTLLNISTILAFSKDKGTPKEEESKFSYGIDAGFSNKYLWRGICYNNGFVFQPDVWVGYGDLSLTTWSNITIWDKNSETSNEVDFTLSYSKSLLNFDIEGSLNYYYYFGAADENTSEFHVDLSYPIGDFSIFTGFSVDILEYTGSIYDELGIEYEKKLSDKFSISGSLLTAMANKKFNENYLEVNKSAFNFLGANATLTYSPVSGLYIDAHFQFNHTLDKELDESILHSNSNFFEIILRKEF